MKTILYSVSLTSDAKTLIHHSLCGLFERDFQKRDTARLLGLIREFDFAVLSRERVFLSTGSWLLILHALRVQMKENSGANYCNRLHFFILGVGVQICKRIEDVEGNFANTFKVFCFFMSR